MSQNPSNPFARPTFPPLQPSASSQASTFQSYSSSSSLASESPASSAPLPSPNPQQQYFGSLNAQQQPSQQQQQSQAAAQRQPVQRQSSYNDYVPNRAGAGGTAAETNTYLDQYALLAEAAKRAQMAVVMRDIEGMEL